MAAKSNVINVFTNSRQTHQLEDIVVEDMDYPSDVVGSDDTMKQSGFIWRIDLQTRGNVSAFVETKSYEPWSLSLSRDRLIVTPVE